MKPFLVPKRKLIDLVVLVVLNLILYFFWESFPLLAMFSFGFIWNWSASQELDFVTENPRYRYSMVRFVSQLQIFILRPAQGLPKFTHFFLRILPAGAFWFLVVFINESVMPWWAAFLGSAIFELLQFNVKFSPKEKEIVS